MGHGCGCPVDVGFVNFIVLTPSLPCLIICYIFTLPLALTLTLTLTLPHLWTRTTIVFIVAKPLYLC